MKNNEKIVFLFIFLAIILILVAFGSYYFEIKLSWVVLALLSLISLFLIAYTFEKFPWPALVPLALIIGDIGAIQVRGFIYEYTLVEALIVFIFLGWILHLIIEKKKPVINSLAWLFLIFILFSVISAFWAKEASRSVIAVRILFYHLATFLLVLSSVKDSRNFKYFLGAIPLAGFLVGGQLIYKVYELTRFEFTLLERETVVTVIGAGVYVGAIIVLTIFLTYVFLSSEKKSEIKLLLEALLAFLLFSAFLPTSKAVILTLIIGAIYFLIKIRKTYNKPTFFLALIFSLIIFVIMARPFLESFIFRVENWQRDPTTQFRIKEYRAYSTLISAYPLLGVGSGNLKVYNQELLDIQEYKEANNFIVQVLVELGVVGLSILILMIGNIWFAVRKMGREIKTMEEKILLYAFSATFLMAFINGLFEAIFIGLLYGIIFWYIVGLFFAWQRIKAPPSPPLQRGGESPLDPPLCRGDIKI